MSSVATGEPGACEGARTKNGLTQYVPKCLIVDECQSKREGLASALRVLDCDFHCAASGSEALGLISSHEFSLAIVDVGMLETDGFRLAELMRKVPQANEIPILFLSSGQLDAAKIQRGYELGAVDFCVDPLEPAALVGKVRFLMSLQAQKSRLRLAEERFRSIFENVAVGIAKVGMDGRWIRLNQKFLDVVGWTQERIAATRYCDVVHPEDRAADEAAREELRLGRVPVEAERRFVTGDGHVIWVLCNISLIRGSSGEAGYYIVTAQDITAIKQAKEEADAANRMKTQFLANISHEIRTPMTAILGYSEILASGRLQGDRLERTLSRLRLSGDHLLHLIEDILDLAKFESGRVPFQEQIFSLRDLVSETVESLRPAAERKGLDLNLSVEDRLPEGVRSDPRRIRQVLANLLRNAVKFTDSGGITVRVRSGLGPRLVHASNFEIEIEDTGVGVAADKVASLFKPFSQADTSMTRRHGGSGLGLILSRRIAQALGGDIELRWSERGRGSRFIFRFVASSVADVSAESISVRSASRAGIEMATQG